MPRAPTAGGANCFETVHGNNQYVLTSGEATPPEGPFTSVGAHAQDTCGVRRDGSVAIKNLHLEIQAKRYSSASMNAGGLPRAPEASPLIQ